MKNFILVFIFIICLNTAFSQWEITGWHSESLIHSLYVNKNNILIKSQDGIYISKDNGDNWKIISDFNKSIDFYTVLIKENELFVGTQSDGFWYSSDNGLTWEHRNNGLNGIFVEVYHYENYLFAGTSGDGLFLSTNSGINWVNISSGISNPRGKYIYEIAFNKDTIFAGTAGGVYKSFDMGESWQLKSEGLPDYLYPSYFIFNDKNEIFLILEDGDAYHKFYISKDGGDTWIEKANTIDDGKFTITYTSINDTLIIGAENDLYMSTDFGDTWKKLNDTNHDDDWGLYSLTSSGSDIYICKGGDIFKSTDLGETWFDLKPKKYRYGMVNSLVILKDKLIVSSDRIYPYLNPPGLYISTDFGESWTNTFPNLIYDREEYIYQTKLAVHKDVIFLGTNEGLFRSTDIGGSWEEIYEERKLNVISFAFSGDSVFAVANSSGSVYMSPDLGVSWRQLGNNGLPINKRITSIALAGNYLFIRIHEKEGIFRTSDLGENWKSVNNGLPEKASFRELFSYHNNLYLNILTSNSTNDKGIYFSSDFGDTWELRNKGFSSYPRVQEFYGIGNTVFVGVETDGIYITTDNGLNWVQKSEGLINTYFSSFVSNDEYIFAGTNHGMTGKKGDVIYRAKLSDFGITDVQENKIASQFSIHPNPATEYIEILYGSNGAGSIENNIWASPNASNIKIFNTLGECVLTVETIHELSLLRIDVSHLPRGVYYLRIGSRTQMFVKM